MLKSMTSVRIFMLNDISYPEQCPLCKQFGADFD